MSKKTITIDGVEYIQKDEAKRMELSDDNYVIVRTCSAGVHAGYLKSREGKEVVLNNSRRLWKWKGATECSQLSVDGVKNPTECKFPMSVQEVLLTEAIEIIPCTKKAKESIEGVPVWKM